MSNSVGPGGALELAARYEQVDGGGLGKETESPLRTDEIEPPKRTVLQQFREIGHELWTHRELAIQLTMRDIRLRYKQAVMGFGWALLMPIFVVMAGLIVRYAMASYAGTSLQVAEVGGIAVKAVVWSFFAGALGFSTGSLVANTVLVTKVYFAREVLPIAATVAQAIDSAIGAFAVAVLLVAIGWRPTTALVWLPFLAFLTFTFTVAAGLFLSCANLFYRDVKYIVQIVLTFGIFFTPVLFEPVMFGPRGARLLMLNPLSPLLEGLRLSVVEGHNLLEPLTQYTRAGAAVLTWSPWYLAYSAAWAIFGLALSALMFHKLELIFAEYI